MLINNKTEGREGLTLAPLAAVWVQIIWVKPLRFVQAVKDFPDGHYLLVNKHTRNYKSVSFCYNAKAAKA